MPVANFHVACPITGQAVCYCDSTGGLASKLGAKVPKSSHAKGAALGRSSTKKMWNLWQKLAQGQIMQEPEPAEVLVPCLYSYTRRPEDVVVDGMTRTEIIELVKVKELEAQQAALRAAKAYAAVGRAYTPPEGVEMPAEPLDIKETESAEVLLEVLNKVQEELKAIEAEESRLQKARAAQQAQQAQQLKAANERKQAAVKQYEVEKAQVDRREAEKKEKERQEQERKEAEARAEAERQKELERQRVEAERRAEEERREAERRAEAERKAEAERQRQEAEKAERDRERQKKMAEAQRAKADNERREAEARRQAQAAAEEARRAREAEKSSERRRKGAMEALAHILDDEDDWLEEEEKPDDGDEEFMPGAKGGSSRARQRKGGSSANDKKGAGSSGGSAFRALEKLADSSLLVSPRQHLGADATLLQLPDGISEDDFDGLGSEDGGETGDESPVPAPTSRGIRSSANKSGRAGGRGAGSSGSRGAKASGNKKPPASVSLNEPSPRDRSSAAAMNRIISTISSKDKDAALQALRSVNKLPPGRTIASPAGTQAGNSNNPLGKVIPTKPRDRPGQPGGSRPVAAAKPGPAAADRGPPSRGSDKQARTTSLSAPKPPTQPTRPAAPAPKPSRQPPPPKAPASSGRATSSGSTGTRAGPKAAGGRAGKVLLKAKDFRPDLTGKTLMLLWPEDATWWKALVLNVDMKQHTVHVYYDTGEEETLNLLESINKGEVAWLQEGESPVPPPEGSNKGMPPPAAPPTSAASTKHAAPLSKGDTGKKRKVPPSNPHRPNTHATGKGLPPPHELNKRPRNLDTAPKSSSAFPPRSAPTKVGPTSKEDMYLDSVTEILSLGNAALHKMVEVYWEEEDIWFRGHIIKMDDSSITVEYLHGVVDDLYEDTDVKIKLLQR